MRVRVRGVEGKQTTGYPAKRRTDQTQGEEDGRRESRVGRKRVGRRERITGHPAVVVERQELAINRQRIILL